MQDYADDARENVPAISPPPIFLLFWSVAALRESLDTDRKYPAARSFSSCLHSLDLPSNWGFRFRRATNRFLLALLRKWSPHLWQLFALYTHWLRSLQPLLWGNKTLWFTKRRHTISTTCEFWRYGTCSHYLGHNSDSSCTSIKGLPKNTMSRLSLLARDIIYGHILRSHARCMIHQKVVPYANFNSPCSSTFVSHPSACLFWCCLRSTLPTNLELSCSVLYLSMSHSVCGLFCLMHNTDFIYVTWIRMWFLKCTSMIYLLVHGSEFSLRCMLSCSLSNCLWW